MKLLYLTLLTLCLLSIEISAQSNVVTERVTEDVEMRIEASELTRETVFHFNNINGDLNVEGYNGDEILITGTKIITGKPNIRHSFDPDEFYLDKLSNNGHLFVFVRHPGLEVEIEDNELSYRSNRQNYWEERIQGFEFNLEIKVPHYLMSEISTINAGEVVVEGLSRGVDASNINGSVILRNVTGGLIIAETVNGNIKAEFNQNPEADVELHTVNGNIEVLALKSFSANVTFKSLHGELYTDFDDRSFRSDRKSKKDGMNRFSIGSSETIQFGQGGPNVQLRLLNGNAYIKQL
ncbi:MAG: hypothetical protein U5K35_08085 [Rhodohalobacter sp.]|nr:hypothetical protein [Rhodohalobacter sp.]